MNIQVRGGGVRCRSCQLNPTSHGNPVKLHCGSCRVEFCRQLAANNMDNNSPYSAPAGATGILPLPGKSLIGFLAAMMAVLIIAVLSFQSLQSTSTMAKSLSQVHR